MSSVESMILVCGAMVAVLWLAQIIVFPAVDMVEVLTAPKPEPLPPLDPVKARMRYCVANYRKIMASHNADKPSHLHETRNHKRVRREIRTALRKRITTIKPGDGGK